MSLAFSKYSGLGNDFVFIDNRQLFFDEDPKRIQMICQRRLGVGADGVVLLENSKKADYKMRIFNADGYEAEMCGNAIRALYLFLEDLQIHKKSFRIETYERVLSLWREGDLIGCEMGMTKDLQLNLKIPLAQQEIVAHFVNTGVPHLVLVTKNLEKVNVLELGRALSHHPLFQPKRTNVNFIQRSDEGIAIRTYERGVEKETLACGTGSAAGAIISSLVLGLASPIEVLTKSGGALKFIFDREKEAAFNISMLGSAKRIYTGSLDLDALLK